MAGNLRKSWQAFKKAHPDFEKSKAFKSDVGPQFDKFDKGCEELSALREATEKRATQLMTVGKSVAAALKGRAGRASATSLASFSAVAVAAAISTKKPNRAARWNTSWKLISGTQCAAA